MYNMSESSTNRYFPALYTDSSSSHSFSPKSSHSLSPPPSLVQPTYIDSIIIACLHGAIEILIDTLSSGSPSKFEKFSFLWSALSNDIEICVRREVLHHSTVSLVAHVNERVEVLAKSAAYLEREHLHLAQACRDKIAFMQTFSEQSRPPSAVINYDTSTSLYEPWRRWFLEHLSWPYPDAHERGYLLRLIPHLTDRQVCNSEQNVWRYNILTLSIISLQHGLKMLGDALDGQDYSKFAAEAIDHYYRQS